MSWQELTIGKRIGVGFGCVLILLVVIGFLSFSGVGGIVKNASEVIDGKALDGVLAQKEVDHLNWAGAVNKLITDETVHTLDVETDHTKCEFGKWLYGDGRKNAESLVPELIPLIKDIEAPHRHLHESAVKIQNVYAKADVHLPEFIARKEIDHLNWTAVIQNAILGNVEAIHVETDHTKCGFGKWLYGNDAVKSAGLDPEMTLLLKRIKEPHEQLHATATKLISAYRMTNPGLLDMLREKLDDHRIWAGKVSEAILERHGSLTVQTDPTRCGFGKWLHGDKAKALALQSPEFRVILEAAENPHLLLHESALKIDIALRKGQFDVAAGAFKKETKPLLIKLVGIFHAAIDVEHELEAGRENAIEIFEEEIIPKLEETRKVLQQIARRADSLLQGYKKAADIYAKETAPSLFAVQELLEKLRGVARDNILADHAMLAAAKGTKRNVAIVSAIGLIVGISLALLIARGIISILSGITQCLDEGAEQVASASGQISSSSQAQAEGASEQAASIEETSSSLEQMSSMTKQNASNASNADNLSTESNIAVNESKKSMSELTDSMNDISKASEETSRIIKTIDEIAFQTNLLALNAAVEAARAGEAGAGFAVVADEVRNLAMRAASAAKDTSGLIEGTTAKVAHGASLVEKTNQVFQKVEDNTGKVASLVAEISAASKDQSDGIEQINRAISAMDKVTQQNASNAEESAAASEEMNSQAEQMKSMVDELVKIVGASSKRQIAKYDKNVGQIQLIEKKTIGSENKTAARRLKHQKMEREVRPEQVIPFNDEDDFKDL